MNYILQAAIAIILLPVLLANDNYKFIGWITVCTVWVPVILLCMPLVLIGVIFEKIVTL